MEDRILFRLVLDNKIVGYEAHLFGDDNNYCITHSKDGSNFFNLLSFLEFVKHDKKELCLNPKADPKNRLFVGDIVDHFYDKNKRFKERGILQWDNYKLSITLNTCRILYIPELLVKVGNIYEPPFKSLNKN